MRRRRSCARRRRRRREQHRTHRIMSIVRTFCVNVATSSRAMCPRGSPCEHISVHKPHSNTGSPRAQKFAPPQARTGTHVKANQAFSRKNTQRRENTVTTPACALTPPPHLRHQQRGHPRHDCLPVSLGLGCIHSLQNTLIRRATAAAASSAKQDKNNQNSITSTASSSRNNNTTRTDNTTRARKREKQGGSHLQCNEVLRRRRHVRDLRGCVRAR